jgi:putative N6-adenine-specific DNA methylase
MGNRIPVNNPQDRQPRRPVASASFRGIALCAVGIEKITATELGRLGFGGLEKKPGRVFFSLNENISTSLARANIGLRTAERILIELGNFRSATFDDFYAGVHSLPWELCLFKDSRIYIERVRTHESILASQSSLQAMAQKAAYDRLMEHFGLRQMPENGNTVAVRVYLENDICSIGVDTSGEPLHKRGYRARRVEAPLKETIAASMLFLSGWNRKYPLFDPFCGSGTIAIEAAMYALDFAPGLNRGFAFESMPMVTKKTVDEARESFEEKIRDDVEFDIRGTDQSENALQIARGNAEIAGVGDWLRFEVGKAEDSAPFSPRGYLLANPPYGNRIGTKEEAAELYASLSGMRQRFSESGWGMGFMTDSENFGSLFGAKPDTSRHITNGAEEQWFHWYPGIAKREDHE